MPLRAYFLQQVMAVTGLTGDRWWDRALHLFVAVMGPLLALVYERLGGLLTSAVFFWMTTFWLLDFITGTIIALKAHKWNARRSRCSVGKWLGWVIALTVAHGLRSTFPVVGQLTAGCVEAAVLFTEGASVLRNLGSLSGGRTPVGRVLEKLARRMEREPDNPDQQKCGCNGRPLVATEPGDKPGS